MRPERLGPREYVHKAADALAAGAEQVGQLVTADYSGRRNPCAARRTVYSDGEQWADRPDARFQNGLLGRLRVYVRCRQCRECKKAEAGFWAARARKEWEAWPTTRFVTLTWNQTSLTRCEFQAYRLLRSRAVEPAGLSPLALQKATIQEMKRDVTKFLKRLRQGSGVPIRFRYFGVFELGEENRRPHFHMLLHEILGACTVERLKTYWGMKPYSIGFVDHRLASDDARYCRYIAKYITKAPEGRKMASLHYGKLAEYPSTLKQ